MKENIEYYVHDENGIVFAAHKESGIIFIYVDNKWDFCETNSMVLDREEDISPASASRALKLTNGETPEKLIKKVEEILNYGK